MKHYPGYDNNNGRGGLYNRDDGIVSILRTGKSLWRVIEYGEPEDPTRTIINIHGPYKRLALAMEKAKTIPVIGG